LEITDLVYLMLLDKFYGMDWDVTLYVGYIYDYKAVDISYADWILIYNRGSSMDWFGIGAKNYLVVDRTTIDVRTASKERYGKLKELIKSVFTGQPFTFSGGQTTILALEEGVDFDNYVTVGMFVDKIHLIDPDAYSFNRGDRIDITDVSQNMWTAYVWGKYDDWLYVLKNPAIYCLIRPRGVDDLSDKMKKMYRFVMDVEGELIEPVGGV